MTSHYWTPLSTVLFKGNSCGSGAIESSIALPQGEWRRSGPLNCNAGVCRCIANGRCDGYCEGNTWVSPGAGQSLTKCGKEGEQCKVCDTSNVCANVSCTAGTCQSSAVPDGSKQCSDNLNCTEDDKCVGGKCKGTQLDCSSLKDQCNVGVCNEAQNKCVKQAANENKTCDDYLFCTQYEYCHSGQCTGGAVRECPSDSCHNPICNESADRCDLQLKADGTACDTGNPCITPGTCGGGVCSSTKKPDGTSCGSIMPQYCCNGVCCNSMWNCCPDKTCKLIC
jgi:hypothetical protein